jgi:hypothetical protein
LEDDHAAAFSDFTAHTTAWTESILEPASLLSNDSASPTRAMRLSTPSVVVQVLAVVGAIWACCGGGGGGIAAADASTPASTAKAATATATTTRTASIIASTFRLVGSTQPSSLRFPRPEFRRRLDEEEGEEPCVPESAALLACTNTSFTAEEDETCGRCLFAAAQGGIDALEAANYTCAAYTNYFCAMTAACPCISPCAGPFVSAQECLVVELVESDTGTAFECNITGSCGSGSGSANGAGTGTGDGGNGTGTDDEPTPRPAFCVAERDAFVGCTNRSLTAEEYRACQLCIGSAIETNFPDYDAANYRDYTCQTYTDLVCGVLSACACLSPCAGPFVAQQECSTVEMVEYNTGAAFECNITGSCGGPGPSGSANSGGGGGGAGTSGGGMVAPGIGDAFRRHPSRDGASLVATAAFVAFGWSSLLLVPAALAAIIV